MEKYLIEFDSYKGVFENGVKVSGVKINRTDDVDLKEVLEIKEMIRDKFNCGVVNIRKIFLIDEDKMNNDALEKINEVYKVLNWHELRCEVNWGQDIGGLFCLIQSRIIANIN